MASTFKFRVFLEDGTDLEEHVTNMVGPWGPGDVLYSGGLPAFRITKVIPVDSYDNGVYDGIWEVKPLTDENRAAALS